MKPVQAAPARGVSRATDEDLINNLRNDLKKKDKGTLGLFRPRYPAEKL